MTLEIRMLGEFRVLDGSRTIPPGAWEHRRSADLVKLLALAPDHRLVKDVVLEALWPQLESDSGSAALHKAASIARKLLGGHRVVLRQGEVALAPGEPVATDVATFDAAARDALADGDPKVCARAATLYAGELLPGDRYEEWVAPTRERLAGRHAELLRRAGAWEELVAHDPLDERAHLKLMRVYADAGNRASALRQFQRMRQLFAEQLGVGPSAEAMTLYETLSRGPAVHAPVGGPTLLAGRDVELARARALVRKVGDGSGHTLLVRGDAGMGKTTFCEHLLVDAAAAGATTLRGAAQLDGPGAYAPVMEAVDHLLMARPDLAMALPKGSRQVLARLTTAAPFEPGDEARSIHRQRVLSAVGQVLVTAAKERTVLLFIDDLHDADDSTLELVHYLASIARTHRILLLLAARPQPRPALERTRATLLGQRALSEIDLAPLSRDEVALLVGRLSTTAPSAATIDAVHGRAAGNPLFAELLAGTSAPAHDLPSDLDAVLAGVILRASEPTVTLLGRLAVLGTQFTMQELLGLSGTGEAESFACLDEALAARLVDEQRGGYRFHHALYAEALLRRLPAHRLRQARRDAARLLASAGAPASRVAHQLIAADETADAVPWLVQAAREEAQVSAYASALHFVELAIVYGGPDEAMLAFRANLLFATGSPEAPAAYARAMNSAAEAARPALRAYKARAHMALGDVQGAAATLGGAEPPEDPAARVVHLTIGGLIAWFSGQADEAERATAAARTLAEELCDPAAVAEAVLARAIVAHSRGGYDAHVGEDLLADRAPALAGMIHEGHLCISSAYVESGSPFPPIDAFAADLRANGERMGARRAVAFADLLSGESALLRGDLANAEAPLARASEMNLVAGSTSAASFALLRRAEVAIAAGDLAAAEPLLLESLELARRSPMGQRHLLQRIYGTRIACEPDPQRAVALVDEATVAAVGPAETCMGCSIAFLVPAVIACAGAGQTERAAALLTMAEQVGAALWPRGPWQAGLDEARAAVAGFRGDVLGRRTFLLRAKERYLEVGYHMHAARCG